MIKKCAIIKQQELGELKVGRMETLNYGKLFYEKKGVDKQ